MPRSDICRAPTFDCLPNEIEVVNGWLMESQERRGDAKASYNPASLDGWVWGLSITGIMSTSLGPD